MPPVRRARPGSAPRTRAPRPASASTASGRAALPPRPASASTRRARVEPASGAPARAPASRPASAAAASARRKKGKAGRRRPASAPAKRARKPSLDSQPIPQSFFGPGSPGRVPDRLSNQPLAPQGLYYLTSLPITAPARLSHAPLRTIMRLAAEQRAARETSAELFRANRRVTSKRVDVAELLRQTVRDAERREREDEEERRRQRRRSLAAEEEGEERPPALRTGRPAGADVAPWTVEDQRDVFEPSPSPASPAKRPQSADPRRRRGGKAAAAAGSSSSGKPKARRSRPSSARPRMGAARSSPDLALASRRAEQLQAVVTPFDAAIAAAVDEVALHLDAERVDQWVAEHGAELAGIAQLAVHEATAERARGGGHDGPEDHQSPDRSPSPPPPRAGLAGAAGMPVCEFGFEDIPRAKPTLRKAAARTQSAGAKFAERNRRNRARIRRFQGMAADPRVAGAHRVRAWTGE